MPADHHPQNQGQQQQQQQQHQGFSAGAGGSGGGGCGASEPWWARFPDFVPVEALKGGRDPR
jgi:hypothetical protein